MKRFFALICGLYLSGLLFSCTGATVKKPDQPGKTGTLERNRDFLTREVTDTAEVFRVILASDLYHVEQVAHKETIKRVEDRANDIEYMKMFEEFDILDEYREVTVYVGLYPESGQQMRIRFLGTTYLKEVDPIIMQDIRRWKFEFPQGKVFPTTFNITYRVVLQKKFNPVIEPEETPLPAY
jgi:hypothetical protein